MKLNESTTFKGNPRAHMNEWVKHELKFFPGVQKLDKLLFRQALHRSPMML